MIFHYLLVIALTTRASRGMGGLPSSTTTIATFACPAWFAPLPGYAAVSLGAFSHRLRFFHVIASKPPTHRVGVLKTIGARTGEEGGDRIATGIDG